MKYFDLTLPKAGEENPKIHKIDFYDFKRSWLDFPREVAERMVELGYGRWVPATLDGKVTVPQRFEFPEQFIFITLPTRSVKAVHVNALVPENGDVPNNLVLFAQNLASDVFFKHDPEDLMDEEEYDALCEDPDEDLDRLTKIVPEEEPKE